MQSLDYMKYMEIMCLPFSDKGKNFLAGRMQECEICICIEFTRNDIRCQPTSRRKSQKFYLCNISYTKVNLACAARFWDRYSKQKKIIDLSMSSQYKGNLTLHVRYSNYVYTMCHAHMLEPQLKKFIVTRMGWKCCRGWVDENSGYFQLTFAMLKSEIETLEKGVKYVQSY